VLALWKGAGPTVVRAMALNLGMVISFTPFEKLFRDRMGFGELPTLLGATAVSGVVAAACSLPFDYVKTQIQSMQPGPNGKYPFSGSLDCARQTWALGGHKQFYRGFGTYCVRIVPHVLGTWILLKDIQVLEEFLGF
jgi:solute carrier family 25 oxoglutarate transporter 11